MSCHVQKESRKHLSKVEKSAVNESQKARMDSTTQPASRELRNKISTASVKQALEAAKENSILFLPSRRYLEAFPDEPINARDLMLIQ